MTGNMNAQATASSRLFRPRTFSARTKARFRRDRENRLIRHLGGTVSDMQRLVIDRIIEVEWSILRLSARSDDAPLSPHAAREMLAFHSHLRLLCRELGLKPTPPPPPTLAEIMARAAAEYPDENYADPEEAA
jgi:hypothetical protein